MSSVTLRNAVDAWVASSATSKNFGRTKFLHLNGNGSDTRYAFLYFTSPVPRGATVLSATLRVYGSGNWGGSATVTAQRANAAWKESQLTWANKPGVTGATVAVTQTETVDATEWAFDVTALMQLIAAGAANYGFRLSVSGTAEHNLYSMQSDHPPVLEVQWSDAPDAPVNLIPSGGAAVHGAKPTLSFNFHDVSGATEMQACQVQIDPAANWASPAFDTGTVLTDDPELDLSTTAYAGLATSATTFWRVRVQDTAGLWSPWSVSASWQRLDLGSVTINNPAASPNNVVNDTTPQISWTVSGATQVARRIVISDDADPTHPLLDTGRQTSSSNAYTPPKGIIKSESTTYRLMVRTWDTSPRVKTANQQIYLEAVRTFTFVEDATVNPVTGLSGAQQPNGRPHVLLSWSRSTAPDSFAVWRDGVCLDSGLSPADLFVSGMSYQYLDVTASPHDTHVYKVRATVNGKQSPSSTCTVSYEVPEVWLSDLDVLTTNRYLPVVPVSGDSLSFDMPEVAAEARPVNGSMVARVVQGQYGLEGTISGRVIDWADGAAKNWVANLLWMKKRPARVYRLTLGAQNLNVRIGHVVVAPLIPALPNQPDARQVSFDFWSIDGVTQQ